MLNSQSGLPRSKTLEQNTVQLRSFPRVAQQCKYHLPLMVVGKIKGALQSIVPRLMQEEGYDCFLVGNYGQFDRLAASVCLAQKQEHPFIRVCLVIPYYRPKLDSYEKEYHARFDDVIVPALEDVPYQYRIVRANEYMVDRAETVIAYVNTPIGGAAKTLAYAKRKKKRIFYLVNNTVNSNRDGSSK